LAYLCGPSNGPRDDAVQRAGRNTSLGRVSAAINCSPWRRSPDRRAAELFEPLVAAAQEEKYGRSESRDRREAEALDDHVEVESSRARGIAPIDQPQRRFDTGVPNS